MLIYAKNAFFLVFQISIFSLLGLSFSACSNTSENSVPKAQADSLRQKLAEYETTIKETGGKMNEITQFLDSVSRTRPELAKVSQGSKQEAKQMLKTLDSVLTLKSEEVLKLSQQLKQKGANYTVLANALENQKKEIERLKSENEDLVRQLDEAKGEVVKLKTENTALATDLGTTKTQLSGKEQELAKLMTDIEKAQATLQTEGAKIKNASTAFYELGQMLVKMADKTWGMTKSDQKKQFTQQAFCAFQKALKLGHVDAQYQMNKMKTNEEFKKYLENVSCE